MWKVSKEAATMCTELQVRWCSFLDCVRADSMRYRRLGWGRVRDGALRSCLAGLQLGISFSLLIFGYDALSEHFGCGPFLFCVDSGVLFVYTVSFLDEGRVVVDGKDTISGPCIEV